MKKILFSDMDGTIMNQDDLLYDKDKEMIEKLRASGHLFAFNTGRNYEEAIKAIRQLDLKYDYLVLNNGAQIIDDQGQELFKKVISNQIGSKIIEHCLNYPDLWLYFYDGQKTLAYFQGVTYEYDHNGKIIESNDYNFLKEYPLVKEFDIIALHQDDQNIDNLLKIQNYIKENYDFEAHGTLNTIYLDITPSNCTKGTGIETLVNLLDDKLISYAIGDSYNDISMFESATWGYTFNHVEDDICKHADKQVEHVADLIAEMINI